MMGLTLGPAWISDWPQLRDWPYNQHQGAAPHGPARDRLQVAGVEVAKSPLEAQRRIGYLPENAPLYDDMMVIDFLRYIAQLRGVGGAELDLDYHEHLKLGVLPRSQV